MFVGYSVVLDHKGQRARLPLWYTWCTVRNKKGIYERSTAYISPYKGDKVLSQSKSPLDISTAPVELTSVSQRHWKARARQLWIAQYGPPTWFNLYDNGCYISEHLVASPEPEPAVNSGGEAGKVWISDTECRARYDDLSAVCEEAIYDRMVTMYICETEGHCGQLAPRFRLREARIARMSANAKRAIEAVLNMVEKLTKETNPNTDALSAHDILFSKIQGLRETVKRIQGVEKARAWNAQT